MNNSGRPDLTSKRESKLPYLRLSIYPRCYAVAVGEGLIGQIMTEWAALVSVSFSVFLPAPARVARVPVAGTLVRRAEAGAGQALHWVNRGRMHMFSWRD